MGVTAACLLSEELTGFELGKSNTDVPERERITSEVFVSDPCSAQTLLLRTGENKCRHQKCCSICSLCCKLTSSPDWYTHALSYTADPAQNFDTALDSSRHKKTSIIQLPQASINPCAALTNQEDGCANQLQPPGFVCLKKPKHLVNSTPPSPSTCATTQTPFQHAVLSETSIEVVT